MKKRSVIFAAALVVLWEAAPTQAGTVEGRFVLDGEALVPSEAAAFRIRDQRDPRQKLTYVMLTTQPVDREAIGQAIEPYAVAINDPATEGAICR